MTGLLGGLLRGCLGWTIAGLIGGHAATTPFGDACFRGRLDGGTIEAIILLAPPLIGAISGCLFGYAVEREKLSMPLSYWLSERLAQSRLRSSDYTILFRLFGVVLVAVLIWFFVRSWRFESDEARMTTQESVPQSAVKNDKAITG